MRRLVRLISGAVVSTLLDLLRQSVLLVIVMMMMMSLYIRINSVDIWRPIFAISGSKERMNLHIELSPT